MVGWVYTVVRKGHCVKLMVFRCLSITATENKERSKGTIAIQNNSGTEEVEVGLGVG